MGDAAQGCSHLFAESVEKVQAVRKYNVETVGQLFPILKVVEVVQKSRIVEVAILCQDCKAGVVDARFGTRREWKSGRASAQ